MEKKDTWIIVAVIAIIGVVFLGPSLTGKALFQPVQAADIRANSCDRDSSCEINEAIIGDGLSVGEEGMEFFNANFYGASSQITGRSRVISFDTEESSTDPAFIKLTLNNENFQIEQGINQGNTQGLNKLLTIYADPGNEAINFDTLINVNSGGVFNSLTTFNEGIVLNNLGTLPTPNPNYYYLCIRELGGQWIPFKSTAPCR